MDHGLRIGSLVLPAASVHLFTGDAVPSWHFADKACVHSHTLEVLQDIQEHNFKQMLMSKNINLW